MKKSVMFGLLLTTAIACGGAKTKRYQQLPSPSLQAIHLVSAAPGHKRFDLLGACQSDSGRIIEIPPGRYQIAAEYENEIVTEGDAGVWVIESARMDGRTLDVGEDFDPSGEFVDLTPRNSIISTSEHALELVLVGRLIRNGHPIEVQQKRTCMLTGKALEVRLSPVGSAKESPKGIVRGEYALQVVGGEECPELAWSNNPNDPHPMWNRYNPAGRNIMDVGKDGTGFHQIAVRCSEQDKTSVVLSDWVVDPCNRNHRCDKPMENYENCKFDCPHTTPTPPPIPPSPPTLPPSEPSASAPDKVIRVCRPGQLERPTLGIVGSTQSVELVCGSRVQCVISVNGVPRTLSPGAKIRTEPHTQYQVEKCD